jgi:hypothetical protein
MQCVFLQCIQSVASLPGPRAIHDHKLALMRPIQRSLYTCRPCLTQHAHHNIPCTAVLSITNWYLNYFSYDPNTSVGCLAMVYHGARTGAQKSGLFAPMNPPLAQLSTGAGFKPNTCVGQKKKEKPSIGRAAAFSPEPPGGATPSRAQPRCQPKPTGTLAQLAQRPKGSQLAPLQLQPPCPAR